MTKLEKLRREYDPTLEEQISDLRAENACLAERLRQTPTVREIVGELRLIRDNLQGSGDNSTTGLLARARLADLLRRLDESQ